MRFNNQPLQLTSFAVVQGILDFNPPAPPPDKDGIVKWPAGTKVSGTVKQTAPVGGQFFFTCGFPQHSNVMVTVPFTVAAASGAPGNREIKSANGPIRWLLDGKYDLNRQP